MFQRYLLKINKQKRNQVKTSVRISDLILKEPLLLYLNKRHYQLPASASTQSLNERAELKLLLANGHAPPRSTDTRSSSKSTKHQVCRGGRKRNLRTELIQSLFVSRRPTTDLSKDLLVTQCLFSSFDVNVSYSSVNSPSQPA